MDNDALARMVKDLEDAHKDFEGRLRGVELTLARNDEKYENIMKEIDKMSKILEELKNRPARNWGTLVSALISGLVGAIIGVMMRGGM